MKGLDLFSGAGGLSLGAKMAGIDVLASVECDRHAVQTYVHNFPEASVFMDDVRKFDPEGIGFKPDLVFGGPPCQGYSTSNQRTRSKKNPNNWLFEELLRVVASCSPSWVVVENVKGLVETEKGFFFKAILDGLCKLGYECSYKVLNAAEYGIPQKRSRLFIVGNNIGCEYCFPVAEKASVVSVRDAISDLPFLQNGADINSLPYSCAASSEYAKVLRDGAEFCTNNIVTRNAAYVVERYKYIPCGGNWENIPEKLMGNYSERKRCHTGIYHRLELEKPSVVLGNFRKNMLVHPCQDRGLSVREAARIQSFPDYFEFKGSIGFQQQQVGNAVPPFLAKQVFDSVISCMRSL